MAPAVLWLLAAALLLLLRLCMVIFLRVPLPARRTPARTMVVLGSGGHTAEMLKLLDSMDMQLYQPRCYVVAATDPMSGPKALAKEKQWQGTDSPRGFKVLSIPRSREVGQSYVTSVFTTLKSMAFAFLIVLRERPEMVLVNGPGTCIPVCVAALLYRVLGLARAQVVYVESIARTRKFSLSARLLYHLRIADLVLVQWEELAKTYPRSVYAGRLY